MNNQAQVTTYLRRYKYNHMLTAGWENPHEALYIALLSLAQDFPEKGTTLKTDCLIVAKGNWAQEDASMNFL